MADEGASEAAVEAADGAAAVPPLPDVGATDGATT